ncbi:hypothetical protein EUX98_g9256 [Antrodiella citrinella]|uniref:N-terminal Ras-GEF domain-containing protein n=1 Tax=Antrodiella citrinella TaxID=2447956 RepID=A0A4S4LVY5_9APHY|nr:hypothetical protein EUX98_g9256 [Antrodiella citrinella]
MSVITCISPSKMRSELVIAIVGAPGTGRTTVIRKGLKAYGLSDVRMTSVPQSSERGGVFNYSYRVGRIVYDSDSFITLRVLEIDIASLDIIQIRASRVCTDGVPLVDGLVICYDASRESSFGRVADLIRAFAHLRLPSVVLACKSDLEKRVDPRGASSVLKSLSVDAHYDVGLVEVTTENAHGKEKIRMAFEWIFRTLLNPEALLTSRDDGNPQYNPASPAILASTPSPWDINRAESATPTASSSFFGSQPRLRLLSHVPPSSSDSTQSPTSPVRARSTNDLLSSWRDSDRDWDLSTNSGSVVISVNGTGSAASVQLPPYIPSEGLNLGSLDEVAEGSRAHVPSTKESRAPPWVGLQDLLNKLLFLAVSDDDTTFINHFLLTYRRFASPRSILLAMQKRMRALDEPSGDPMIACFAQMKICCLLDTWARMYANDFAVPGTAGALSALLKSILGKTYLLQYGSEFIAFMELLPTLGDADAAWAMKVEAPKYDSDDESSIDLLALSTESPMSSISPLPDSSSNSVTRSRTQSIATNRDRKSSLPLSHRSTMMGSPSPVHAPIIEAVSSKVILKNLQAICAGLDQYDPTDIAQEITRHEKDLFLLINPRNWMQHVLSQGKKDAGNDPIAVYNRVSNHIAHWEVHLSDLIRAHEGNPDFHDDDPEKIHWAKFSMMGRFIDVVTQCQKVCRDSKAFDFPDRPMVWKLLMFQDGQMLMNEELQRERTSMPDIDGDDPNHPSLPRTFTRNYPTDPKDSAILRRFFFW